MKFGLTRSDPLGEEMKDEEVVEVFVQLNILTSLCLPAFRIRPFFEITHRKSGSVCGEMLVLACELLGDLGDNNVRLNPHTCHHVFDSGVKYWPLGLLWPKYV
ncbi:MAG: hypothetical protein JKX70_02935 [Phycisphaerales bacterium]|nr:hypothetical protein [Phycisphaerales bacterium]